MSKQKGHKCPWEKANTCYLNYECNGCETHAEYCKPPTEPVGHYIDSNGEHHNTKPPDPELSEEQKVGILFAQKCKIAGLIGVLKEIHDITSTDKKCSYCRARIEEVIAEDLRGKLTEKEGA